MEKSDSRWHPTAWWRNSLWLDTCSPSTTSAYIHLNADRAFRSFSSTAATRSSNSDRRWPLMFAATSFYDNRGRLAATAFSGREQRRILGREPRRLSDLSTPPCIDPASHFASPGRQNFFCEISIFLIFSHLKWLAVAFVAVFPIGYLAIFRAIKHLTAGALVLGLTTTHFTICHNFTRPCSLELITLMQRHSLKILT